MNKNSDQKALGARLRKAREYSGFSQDQAAKFLIIPRSAMSQIETGQRKIGALELKKLADLYLHPITYFITGETKKESHGAIDDEMENLTESDRAEVFEFVRFIHFYNKNKKERANHG